MALEELIVAWSQERPPWQREVMRRVAAGEVLSNEDYDSLVEVIMGAQELPAGQRIVSRSTTVASPRPKWASAGIWDRKLLSG